MSPYNAAGLISKIMGYFNDNSIDLYSILGKVDTRKRDGSEVCHFDISFDNRDTQGCEALENSLRQIGLTLKLQDPPRVDWFPTSLEDLNHIGKGHAVDQVDLDELPHKGSGKKYSIKRQALIEKLKSHKVLDAIPELDWDESDQTHWEKMFNLVNANRKSYSCRDFNRNFETLVKEQLISMDFKPDINRVNKFLINRNNWRMKAVAAPVSPREFLNALALRTLCFSLHVRDAEGHPESDLVHQLLGQVPGLLDPRICQMLQTLGALSLGATDLQIRELLTIYWHNFEFGLVREAGKLKFLGAAYQASTSHLDELDRLESATDASEGIQAARLAATKPFAEFELGKPLPTYFFVDELDDLEAEVHAYAKSFFKPFNLRYDFVNNTYEADRAVVAVLPSSHH